MKVIRRPGVDYASVSTSNKLAPGRFYNVSIVKSSKRADNAVVKSDDPGKIVDGASEAVL